MTVFQTSTLTATTMARDLKITFGGATSAGIKPRNEDAFAAILPDALARHAKGAVACIADGVSCSENAQLASETSVTTFIQDYLSTPESWDVKTASARVLSALNAWLYHQGQVALARHNSLVTTFTGIIFKSQTAHILHTGDSRLYRYRDGQLVQLTRDHSILQHDGNAVITRALGMESQLQVDYSQHSLRENDLFLLTSDGVHDYLSENTLQRLLAGLEPDLAGEGKNAMLEQSAGAIVRQAEAAQSRDNLTCLLIRILEVPLADIDETHRRLTEKVIPPVLSPGVKLDDYTIRKVLNSGVRSHIYLAENPRFREPFVLKVPSERFAEDAQYLESFVRELWVGRRIDHPGIMKIFDPPQDTHFLYHVCEYVPGITLRQWIYDNPAPELKKVRDLLTKLVPPLRAFHRMGMLHRDLKPENIMVTTNGDIKLIDFGTVKVRGLQEIASPVADDTPVGSVDYIAPEYLLGDKGMHRSDIFSLGVIVYEMLTGKLPFKPLIRKDGQASSFDQWRYISASQQRKDIPVWLDLALQKACAPRPGQRYQVLSEFFNDMQTPNQALLEAHADRPLIDKHPVKFWQAVSALLFILLLLQMAWPYL
jgi:protein phosphatase